MPWLASLARFEACQCIAIGGFSEPIRMASVARENKQGWQRLRALLQGSWQCRIQVPAASYTHAKASQTPGKLNAEEMVLPKLMSSHLGGKQNHQVRDKETI